MGKYSKAKRYLKEVKTIFYEFPETNTALFIDYNFLTSAIECNIDNTDISELNNILENLIHLQYKAFLATTKSLDESVNIVSENDFYANRFLNAAQEAIYQNRGKVAGVFIKLAELYASRKDVADETREYILDYGAYYDVQYSGNYLDALCKYQQLIEVREKTESKNLETTYLNFISLYERATICNRYFYANAVGTIEEQDTENYIPVLEPTILAKFLDVWEEVANSIITNHGEEYFNALICSSNHLSSNQSVFPLFSIEDTELMRVHNYVRNRQYDKAFDIAHKLIDQNSLNDEKVKDLIWGIDNNLYLHTDYQCAHDFLTAIEKRIGSFHVLVLKNGWIMKKKELKIGSIMQSDMLKIFLKKVISRKR